MTKKNKVKRETIYQKAKRLTWMVEARDLNLKDANCRLVKEQEFYAKISNELTDNKKNLKESWGQVRALSLQIEKLKTENQRLRERNISLASVVADYNNGKV